MLSGPTAYPLLIPICGQLWLKGRAVNPLLELHRSGSPLVCLCVQMSLDKTLNPTVTVHSVFVTRLTNVHYCVFYHRLWNRIRSVTSVHACCVFAATVLLDNWHNLLLNPGWWTVHCPWWLPPIITGVYKWNIIWKVTRVYMTEWLCFTKSIKSIKSHVFCSFLLNESGFGKQRLINTIIWSDFQSPLVHLLNILN